MDTKALRHYAMAILAHSYNLPVLYHGRPTNAPNLNLPDLRNIAPDPAHARALKSALQQEINHFEGDNP